MTNYEYAEILREAYRHGLRSCDNTLTPQWFQHIFLMQALERGDYDD